MAYFTFSNLSANTKALASAVNALFSTVQASFDKLPSEDALKQDRWNAGTTTGVADAYDLTTDQGQIAYTDGMKIACKFHATNTGASTVNVDGLGAKSIKRIDGTDPAAADLTTGDWVEMRYDGTNFVIMSAVRSAL